MPTHFTGRVTLILVVVLVALWAIFPRGDIRHPSLRPGIDMVGGTSLLYEIKTPAGGIRNVNGQTLAESVMEALKKRVDPTGVRNLIWRPQGNERLEIQMPLNNASSQASARKDEFLAAQKNLESTNVRVFDVAAAVEEMKGAERDTRLKALAMDSAKRNELFTQLAKTFDDIQDAKSKMDAPKQAMAETKYDDLKSQIAATNLPAQNLQDALDLKKKETREEQLAKLKTDSSNFPSREKAIEDFTTKYASYSEVKASIDDAGELKRLLKGSGVLEFHIVAVPGTGQGTNIDNITYRNMVDRLQKDGPAVRAGDTLRWFRVDNPEEFKRTTFPYNGNNYVLAWITPDKALMHGPNDKPWGLASASGGNDSTQGGKIVQFNFDSAGAVLFGKLTGANINQPLGIVLDDRMISAPNINSQINGSGMISGGEGGFGAEEQRYLVATLSAGSLPAQLTDEPISEHTVSSLIGADNLRAGLLACAFGLVVVGIFLIGYYYLAGVVAFVAVCINVILILGIMAMLNATFTLPGIAGIVLAIGAAVDANVLIFERLREEQHRGLSLKMALRNSYDRAISAILDSNMTTVITSAVLYWLGTEEVKGFGITLLIGLCSSMFTALFVTKTIFGILIEKFGVTDLRSLPRTFKKWDDLLLPNVDWMGKVGIFLAISTVLVAIGCASFFWYGHKGELLDIEFASGTSVQFELKQPMHIDEVRKLIPQDNPELPAPAVVSVGSGDKTYEVVTPSADSPKVKAVILASMGDRLKLDLPSQYENVNMPGNETIDKSIFAIEKENVDSIKKATGGFLPSDWLSYRGGAAFVLKNIEPPLSPVQIRQRIDRERLLPGGNDSSTGYRDIAVQAPNGENEPTATAVVFVFDQGLPFHEDANKWRDNLVIPTWKQIGDAVNKPATLQKVSNFNPQVAGDTQRDAMLALLLSILVIMAYIWLRFGNLKFGTATVLAMIHDTLLVIAAIGLSHLLVQFVPPLARLLLLEPFRLNITTVAAILTVMSYSMIDTIVVFDRVRENRGRSGHIDRKVINDSINQTMSRTLLTAGTNIVTLLFMYVFGGPGIHGFTFILLFGILVGTYSSIAIAAPILLVSSSKNAVADLPVRGRATAAV